MWVFAGDHRLPTDKPDARLGGIKIGPDELQVTVTREQIESAPNIEQHGEELSQADESALYHQLRAQLHPTRYRERTPPRSPLTPDHRR
jgi:hypothetical protein